MRAQRERERERERTIGINGAINNRGMRISKI